MKLTALQEARYAQPHNVFVYVECGVSFGDRGFTKEDCFSFIGKATAAPGYYEIPYDENPWERDDAHAFVFHSYEEAEDWAKDNSQIIQYREEDTRKVGEYLASRDPDEPL